MFSYTLTNRPVSDTTTETPSTLWLQGWSRRLKMTVDQSAVDDYVVNFPVSVYISNASGKNVKDLSAVLSYMVGNANRKKIAITTNDGTTQCYVEVRQ